MTIRFAEPMIDWGHSLFRLSILFVAGALVLTGCFPSNRSQDRAATSGVYEGPQDGAGGFQPQTVAGGQTVPSQAVPGSTYGDPYTSGSGVAVTAETSGLQPQAAEVVSGGAPAAYGDPYSDSSFPTPAASASSSTVPPATSSSPAGGGGTALSPATGSGGTYVVQPGDSLWKISRDHNTTVAAIKEANAMADDLIKPGDELRIP